MESMQGPPPRVAALSLPGRIAVAVTVGVVSVAALLHLAMVFLHVAPSNTLSKEHAAAVSDYIYPEFEQNWKLFAPDPLQQNIHVEARAEVRQPGGALKTTGWVDMTGMDIAAMRHDPLPSHTQQNELRRAWGFYTDTHDQQEQPNAGDRSDMSRDYLQRILQDRFGSRLDGGDVVRIQARAATTQVPQPSWAAGATSSSAEYRTLPWWTVSAASAGQENAS
ncbi:hypothetical protein GA0115240_101216 [Streptomyces sp. DvalAA-14]|uniref:DUF5819 family protein n=1 Tax=unclassified Streptomyces TaxID=2593676 RepID=UPI00081BBA1E|nr:MULTISPECIES: DUF5819 family protein [unclassified Streptomyces]MYS18788.1 hypothetical protein [Streptomyces sp. SID4948]SCD29430.1 hypothetical protein GA0115240_101216 [Streptomyces sp. DvalAA-14]